MGVNSTDAGGEKLFKKQKTLFTLLLTLLRSKDLVSGLQIEKYCIHIDNFFFNLNSFFLFFFFSFSLENINIPFVGHLNYKFITRTIIIDLCFYTCQQISFCCYLSRRYLSTLDLSLSVVVFTFKNVAFFQQKKD